MSVLEAHPHAAAVLGAALRGRPSHAYLLHGPAGSGKREAARGVRRRAARRAARRTRRTRGARAAHGAHPDLTWVAPSGAHEMLRGDVDESVVAAAAHTPFEASYRVFVLERADTMNDQAANTLLKTLEEPPRYVVLLLLTDRRRRCCRRSPRAASPCASTRRRRPRSRSGSSRSGVAPDRRPRLRAALARRRRARAGARARRRPRAARPRRGVRPRAAARRRRPRRAAVERACSTPRRTARARRRGRARGGAGRGARVPAEEGAPPQADRVHRARPPRRAPRRDRRARPRAPARRPLVPRPRLRGRRTPRSSCSPPTGSRSCAPTPPAATPPALQRGASSSSRTRACGSRSTSATTSRCEALAYRLERALACRPRHDRGPRPRRVRDGARRTGIEDEVAVEEPLEIRVDGAPLAVTMRTPGDDEELALGFLHGEGLIDGPRDGGPPADLAANTIEVAGPLLREPGARSFYTTSSCGVCGKGALEEVAVHAPPVADGPADRARRCSPRCPTACASRPSPAPAACTRPGCSAPAGELLVVREDVGRHNAMDKVVGWALLDGLVPLHPRSCCASPAGCRSSSSRRRRWRARRSWSASARRRSLAVRLADDRGITLPASRAAGASTSTRERSGCDDVRAVVQTEDEGVFVEPPDSEFARLGAGDGDDQGRPGSRPSPATAAAYLPLRRGIRSSRSSPARRHVAADRAEVRLQAVQLERPERLKRSCSGPWKSAEPVVSSPPAARYSAAVCSCDGSGRSTRRRRARRPRSARACAAPRPGRRGPRTGAPTPPRRRRRG